MGQHSGKPAVWCLSSLVSEARIPANWHEGVARQVPGVAGRCSGTFSVEAQSGQGSQSGASSEQVSGSWFSAWTANAKSNISETAEIILEIVYGYKVDIEGGDPLLHKVNEALRQVSAAFVPGRWAVDIFPVLEHIPDWFPGAEFKRTARCWKQTLTCVINVPFELVKTQMSLGHARTSFVSKSIEEARLEGEFGPEEEHAIKWAAGSMYTAGADTSVSIMTAFFLAMSMFPHVQRKAQEEMDRVVGTSRLPTFSDRENLPYTNAVVEEAQRWHPITPMGLPHVAACDDSIGGFRIPVGAIVFPAVWWFTRDPATHHEPETFKPERFLEPYNEPSATSVIFGFGRRICPGKTLADSTLFLTVAQSLAALSIRKTLDERGHEIEPKHTFGPGVLALPGPFKINVAPRSKEYERLIEKVGKQYAPKQSGAESLKSMGLQDGV